MQVLAGHAVHVRYDEKLPGAWLFRYIAPELEETVLGSVASTQLTDHERRIFVIGNDQAADRVQFRNDLNAVVRGDVDVYGYNREVIVVRKR